MEDRTADEIDVRGRLRDAVAAQPQGGKRDLEHTDDRRIVAPMARNRHGESKAFVGFRRLIHVL
jgi:hypothetical protein